MALRRSIRKKLPDVDFKHRGFLYDSVNKNREYLKDCVLGLTLEVMKTLPQELAQHVHFSGEDGSVGQDIAGLLILSSQDHLELFSSQEDCHEFQLMCMEEVSRTPRQFRLNTQHI